MEVIDNKYRVLRTLGKGGVGTVFVAWHEKMQKEVAVKVLTDAAPESPELRRFHQEAQALSSCKHPGIVSIHAFGVTQDHKPYYVMDYIVGKSLAAEIKDSGPLQPARFAQVFDQILSALQHAHDNGLVHRDIKPSNIMLTKDTQGGERAVLIDFGLTRSLQRDVKLTATDALLGTPYYMSPEQCTAGKADNRSDLYSLGCTMFEAATGKLPFTGEAFEILVAHVSGAPDAVPRELVPLMEGMLAKNPADRFPNANAARQSLKSLQLERFAQFSTGKHVIKTGPGQQQQTATKDQTRTNNTIKVLGTVATMLIATAAGATYFSAQRQPEGAEVAKEMTQPVPKPVQSTLEDLEREEKSKDNWVDEHGPETAAHLYIRLADKWLSRNRFDKSYENYKLSIDTYKQVPKYNEALLGGAYIQAIVSASAAKIPYPDWESMSTDAIELYQKQHNKVFEMRTHQERGRALAAIANYQRAMSEFEAACALASQVKQDEYYDPSDVYASYADTLHRAQLNHPRMIACTRTAVQKLIERQAQGVRISSDVQERLMALAMKYAELHDDADFMRAFLSYVIKVAADNQSPGELRTRSFVHASWLSSKLRDKKGAKKYSEEALATAQKLDDPILLAFVYHSRVGVVDMPKKQRIEEMQEACKLVNKYPELTGAQCTALSHLAYALEKDEQFSEAYDTETKAAGLMEQYARSLKRNPPSAKEFMDAAISKRLFATWYAHEMKDAAKEAQQRERGLKLLREAKGNVPWALPPQRHIDYNKLFADVASGEPPYPKEELPGN
jgi:serine/threonine protein kinase